MAAKIGPQSQSHGTKGRVCNHSTDFPILFSQLWQNNKLHGFFFHLKTEFFKE